MGSSVGAPGQMWEVYVVEYARSKDQPVATLIQGAYDKGAIDLPFAFVLARSGNRNVLVDCGFMKEGNGIAVAEKFGIPSWISPVRMVEEMGVLADDITDIVLSHAHFDHMGSVEKFPNAKLHLQKRELLSWIELMAMPRQFGFLTAVLDPDDIYSALDAAKEHRLMLVEGDEDDVVPGIHVRSGPGHTFGQQFVILETAKGRVVVAGDCIYGAQNLTGTNNDGVYIPLGSGIGSALDQLKSVDRINKEIGGDLDRLVILHDFDRWSRFAMIKEVDGFRVFRAA
ncbi:MAG TPA: N-acyl homoserine lactonase family protein [Acidisoma sp.]|uniref:N-acyl homoserine lactonase family protein n=1 Tax=Acidisoma sp. TaxID=1872115 RepID=UPI002B6D87E6|nr:N-acyl homoserine lactonase family protein [Acidisoma sp.]HTI01748.1 N-acyl homoserine lactonase family protein [Acidisoma sp.]